MTATQAGGGNGFPMRINKYLAHKGIATRRAADLIIASGKVYVNGQVAELGTKVNESDTVEVRPDKRPKAYAYFAYHKPHGVITHSPQNGEQDIAEALRDVPGARDVFPIGRLDKSSHGLIILTNDGRITDRLLNPEYEHEKEYVVVTKKPMRASFVKAAAAGMDLGDFIARPAQVTLLGENRFRIVLKEGKKHQIRRMVDQVGNTIHDLERVRIMNVKLGALKPGEIRPIEGAELKTFLKSLGL